MDGPGWARGDQARKPSTRPARRSRTDADCRSHGAVDQRDRVAANLPRLQVNVTVAEGGSFSFISGVTPRAPRWLRRLGLEWLYRLARQPWRLRRQLAIPQFVWLVVRERLRRD